MQKRSHDAMLDVDFDWYRSFLAIYRIGTVSGAAQARFLTQPAVTQHLAALESAVGAALFTRTPRRMVPTERGKELYCHVIQALEKLEQVSQELRDTHASQLPLVRLGAPLEYFSEVALARLKNIPFRLWVQFGITQQLVEGLAQGELDLVVATQRLPQSDVEYRRLEEEHFLLVGSPDVVPPEIEGEDAESLSQLEQWLQTQPWISYGVELPIIRRFWQQLFDQRVNFQPTFVIPNLHAIEKAVELGYGISILPEYLCREAIEAGRLRVIWDSLEPTVNELWLAYRKMDRYHPEIQRVRELLRATAELLQATAE